MLNLTRMSIVGWCSIDEWFTVHSNLLEKRKEALDKMIIWRRRMGKDTPVGILATIATLTAIYEIENNHNKPEQNQFALIYCASGALMQGLGLMIERFRTENQPMHMVGRDLGLPDWVINLRHSLAHGPGETTLQSLTDALYIVLDSLVKNPNCYWVQQYDIYDKERNLKSRELSKEEKCALKNLVYRISNDPQSGKVKDEFIDICSEVVYRKYMIQLLLEHLLEITDTNIMEHWAKILEDLDLVVEFAHQFSEFYKVYCEGI